MADSTPTPPPPPPPEPARKKPRLMLFRPEMTEAEIQAIIDAAYADDDADRPRP